MSTFPLLPPPTSINDVLAQLDAVIAWAKAEPSRLGYFAALYRRVTLKVKQGIEQGFFEDGARMERLDVVFAGRYLEALRFFAAGRAPTTVWQVAFDGAARRRPLILQQLLAGINAHINLDLGIAAAMVAPGAALPPLQGDFDRINDILFSLVQDVEQAIAEVSPGIAWLEKIGGKADDLLVRFSLKVARAGAWRLATRLAALPAESWFEPVAARDRDSARLGEEILDPGPFLRFGLLLIRLRETNDVRRVIELLDRRD